MNIILSHTSALEHVRFASIGMPLHSTCLEELRVAALPRAAGARILAASRPSAGRIDDIRRSGFDYLSNPVHLLVPSSDARCRAQGVSCHRCTGRLPSRWLIEAGEQVFATSPEFTFVLVAAESCFIEAVAVGFELCGTYARTLDGRSDGLVRRDPLTTVESIRKFIEKTEARCGVKKARAALAFVRPGSASAMETALFLLLCLPRRLGGYGLPEPRMNSGVTLGAEARKAAKGDRCVCDLLWPCANLAIEYDSNRWHTGASRIARDANRRVVLSHQGIEVVTVTWDQVRSREKLDQVARLIARRLGVRLRERDERWHASNRDLRSQVLAW